MPTPHTSDGIGTLRLTERSWEAKAARAACAAALAKLGVFLEVLSEMKEAKEATEEVEEAMEVVEEATGLAAGVGMVAVVVRMAEVAMADCFGFPFLNLRPAWTRRCPPRRRAAWC